jgi:hypothetical protein
VRTPASFFEDSIFSSFAAEDADEATHSVRLPARSLHDLGGLGDLSFMIFSFYPGCAE